MGAISGATLIQPAEGTSSLDRVAPLTTGKTPVTLTGGSVPSATPPGISGFTLSASQRGWLAGNGISNVPPPGAFGGNGPHPTVPFGREGATPLPEWMLQPQSWTAEAVLARDGMPSGEIDKTLAAARMFVQTNGQDPVEGFGKLMRDNRLLILGEAHDFNGRYLSAELVRAAADNGATVLFVEGDISEQAKFDNFMRTGNADALPVEFGGDSIYNKPYVDALRVARERGMQVVAVDPRGNDLEQRNAVMSQRISNYLASHPQAKGVFIVGQRHVDAPSGITDGVKTVQDRFTSELRGQTAVIGRFSHKPTLIDYGVIASAAGNREPTLVTTRDNPLVALPDRSGGARVGQTMDYLLIYPYQPVPEQ
jgi:hypothetical protein